MSRPPRRIFLDTEWTQPPWSADCALMWIGLADEAGRSWYGISSEVEIDPGRNAFVAGAFRLIHPDEPRASRAELACAVAQFCGAVDEFWVWIPTLESFRDWSGLGEAAQAVYQRCRDIDLQMLKGLVQPWPAGWPHRVHDLNAAAREAAIELPPRAANHLHPQVHAQWNRTLFQRICGASDS